MKLLPKIFRSFKALTWPGVGRPFVNPRLSASHAWAALKQVGKDTPIDPASIPKPAPYRKWLLILVSVWVFALILAASYRFWNPRLLFLLLPAGWLFAMAFVKPLRGKTTDE